MQNYKESLELQSYVNFTRNIEKNYKIYVPEDLAKYASLYHCADIQRRVKENSKILKHLTIGLNNQSCIVVDYVVNTLLQQTHLWAGVNNLTADIMTLEENDIKFKDLNILIEEMYEVYETVANSSIEKVVEKVKFDPKKYKNPDDYAESIIQKTDEIRELGLQSLKDLKDQKENIFTKQMKKMYQICIENIQLQELLSECYKKIFKFS